MKIKKTNKVYNILVKNIDIELLKRQRDFLLEGNNTFTETEEISGLINLLDHMIDEVEDED